MTGRKGSRSYHVCYCCGLDRTYIDPRNKQHWHLNHDLDGNALCHRCYSHFYSNSWRNYPDRHPLYRVTYKAKHYDRLVERDRVRNRSEKRHKWQRDRLVLWRNKLLDILGRKCVECGYDGDVILLQLDHINGGGLKDSIRIQGNRRRSHIFYKYYVSHPNEARTILQTLCIKCNWIKKFPVDYMSDEWINGLDKTKKHRVRLRDRLVKIIGGWKCVICGCDDPRALQIDHINGGGHIERTKFKFNCDAFNRYYVIHPEESKSKLRILCVVCNNKKKILS